MNRLCNISRRGGEQQTRSGYVAQAAVKKLDSKSKLRNYSTKNH